MESPTGGILLMDNVYLYMRWEDGFQMFCLILFGCLGRPGCQALPKLGSRVPSVAKIR